MWKHVFFYRDSTRVQYVKLGLKEFQVEFGLCLTPASLRASDGGVDPMKISGLILQVKELLPDLQESFIQVSSIPKSYVQNILYRKILNWISRFA